MYSSVFFFCGVGAEGVFGLVFDFPGIKDFFFWYRGGGQTKGTKCMKSMERYIHSQKDPRVYSLGLYSWRPYQNRVRQQY